MTPDEFLLGASDFTRQGALRFRGAQDSAFLADHQTLPRLLHLDTLLEAADQIAADPGTLDWEPFKRLLDVGSGALGGARPKAAVTDGDGLWIAKFPQRGDRANVPVWEMVCLDIADRAGLATPVHRLECVDGRQVLLVKRFDRDDDGRRVPYISARTLLNAQDLGSTGEYGASGIAGRLRTESADPKRDLGQLWRLAALNLLINNTDNHLRNHGFVRSGRGWSLSPAFDLEPNPDTGSTFTGTLFGGAAQRATGLRGLLAIAGDCGLDAAGARVVLDQVHQAVGGWSDDAQRYGANASEIALFEDCFTDLDDAVRAAVSSGLH
ncbi:MAG TPA: HipA domain-containing protein [Nocardioidaceae bacterium]|nr:HipA domain-containing protein [Nocardioidaceae bacterium]